MPVFYGTRDGAQVLASVSNGDQIKADIFDKLTNTVTNHLSKANRQFADYRARKKPKNSVSICVILNSGLKEFTPETVAAVIHRRMNVVPKEGLPRFYDVDAVVYISEKHVTRLKEGLNAFPIVLFEGAGVSDAPWKEQFIRYIVAKWSEMRTDGGMHEGKAGAQFSAVEDIPDRMTRSESTRVSYQRNPTLRHLTDTELRLHWNRNAALGMLAFVKGDWPRPTPGEQFAQLAEVSRLGEEINFRGIDLRDFSPATLSAAERAQVLLGLPEEVAEMFPGGDDESSS